MTDAGHTDPTTDAGHADPATGTVGGHAFTFAHGIAFRKTIASSPGYEIFLSNQPIDCDHVSLEGAVTVDIDVAGDPPAAQTYTVIRAFEKTQGAGEVSADFNALDATCGTLTSDSSLSGSVVLTKFDGTTVDGSLDVSFETNASVADGRVAGTFRATVCAGAFPSPSCTPH